MLQSLLEADILGVYPQILISLMGRNGLIGLVKPLCSRYLQAHYQHEPVQTAYIKKNSVVTLQHELSLKFLPLCSRLSFVSVFCSNLYP